MHSRALALLPDDCPPGFHIPSDPSSDNPFIWHVNTTLSNCAVGCIVPFYSDDEWDMLETTHITSLAVGLILASFLVLTWVYGEKKNQQFIVFLFAALAMIQSVAHVVLQSIPRQQRFCSDKATVMSPEDGWTVCSVHSFVEVYCSLAICLCWMCQAIGVYRKVVVGVKFNPAWKHHIVAFILGTPVLSLIGLGVSGGYGYTWSGVMCQINAKAYSDGIGLYLLGLPVLVCTTVGLFCMISVIHRIISVLVEVHKAQARVFQLEQQELERDMRDIEELDDEIDDELFEMGPRNFGAEVVESNGAADISETSVDNDTSCSNANDSIGKLKGSCRTFTSEMSADKFMPSLFLSEHGPVQSSFSSPDLEAAPPPDRPTLVATSSNRNRARTCSNHSMGSISNLAKTSPAVGMSKLWSMVAFLRIPITFTFFFGVLYVAGIVFTFSVSMHSQEIIDSATDWAQCVLLNYDGDPTQQSWVTPCGVRPPGMLPMSTKLFLVVLFSGSSLFCALIHLPEIYEGMSALWVHTVGPIREKLRKAAASIPKRTGSTGGLILPPSILTLAAALSSRDGPSQNVSFVVVDTEGEDNRRALSSGYSSRFESNYQDLLLMSGTGSPMPRLNSFSGGGGTSSGGGATGRRDNDGGDSSTGTTFNNGIYGYFNISNIDVLSGQASDAGVATGADSAVSAAASGPNSGKLGATANDALVVRDFSPEVSRKNSYGSHSRSKSRGFFVLPGIEACPDADQESIGSCNTFDVTCKEDGSVLGMNHATTAPQPAESEDESKD